jgi:hypothetical protein
MASVNPIYNKKRNLLILQGNQKNLMGNKNHFLKIITIIIIMKTLICHFSVVDY